MTNTLPLVSVVIPAYNRAHRITNTLDAVINQDYENLEIIVVNDGSTDDTETISRNILSQSTRNFTIINNGTNKGKSLTRNAGLDASHGKYVWFCDSDDIADKNFVSTLVSIGEHDNSDIIFCNIVAFFEKENRYLNYITFEDGTLSPQEYFSIWATGKLNQWGCHNCLLNRSFLVKNKLRYRKGLSYGQDGDFIVRAIIAAKFFSCTTKTRYIYMNYSDNIDDHNKREIPKNYIYVVRAENYIARSVIRYTNDRKVIDFALSYYMAHEIMKMCKFCAKTGDRESYDYMIKKFRHKKIREVMCSTRKFIFREPESFLKSLMLLYFPNFYYRMRS